jgi:hypothetical protein
MDCRASLAVTRIFRSRLRHFGPAVQGLWAVTERILKTRIDGMIATSKMGIFYRTGRLKAGI